MTPLSNIEIYWSVFGNQDKKFYEDPDNILDWFGEIRSFAIRLLEEDKRVYPVALALCHFKDKFQQAAISLSKFFDSPKTKEDWLTLIGPKVLRSINAIAVVTVSEAWYLTVKTDEDHILPSQSPERKEAVICSLEYGDTRRLFTQPFDRDSDGEIILLERPELQLPAQNKENITGAFFGMLNRTLPEDN